MVYGRADMVVGTGVVSTAASGVVWPAGVGAPGDVESVTTAARSVVVIATSSRGPQSTNKS